VSRAGGARLQLAGGVAAPLDRTRRLSSHVCLPVQCGHHLHWLAGRGGEGGGEDISLHHHQPASEVVFSKQHTTVVSVKTHIGQNEVGAIFDEAEQ
jgi:hypothetical protein